jgi:hypothetical protein
LRPGCNVFAVIKSVSVAPADVSVDDEALSASKEICAEVGDA